MSEGGMTWLNVIFEDGKPHKVSVTTSLMSDLNKLPLHEKTMMGKSITKGKLTINVGTLVLDYRDGDAVQERVDVLVSLWKRLRALNPFLEDDIDANADEVQEYELFNISHAGDFQVDFEH